MLEISYHPFELNLFLKLKTNICQAAFGQRKYIRENALNEFTKLLQNQV